MGLFICSKCKTIDNTNLIKPVCDDNGMIVDLIDYPNLCQMEMNGFLEGVANEDHLEHVNMLCSFCNTGEWHNEFERQYATPREEKLAALSSYNMITPHDHPKGMVVSDDNERHGYRLATLEEIIEYDRKHGRRAKEFIGAVTTMSGVSIEDMIPKKYRKRDRYAGQSESEKQHKLIAAKIKRVDKKIKKEKDELILTKLYAERRSLLVMRNSAYGVSLTKV